MKQVIQILSDVSGPCAICGDGIGFSNFDEAFEKQINHYLGHGCRLLHVGQESSTDGEGNPYQRTTAVLGVPTP